MPIFCGHIATRVHTPVQRQTFWNPAHVRRAGVHGALRAQAHARAPAG